MSRGLIEPKEGPRCYDCPLFKQGIPVTDRMPLEDDWCGLTLVGEQPGRVEVKTGVPFSGPSGKLLWAICDQSGVPRDSLHVTNCIRCGLPGGAKLSESKTNEAINCCRELLTHNLKILQPKMACAVGAIPWLSLSGLKGIDKWRGTVQPGTDEEPWSIMATLHPAGLLRVESRRILVELMIADIRHAYQLATGKIELWEPNVADTTHWDTVEHFMRKAEAQRVVAVDVETDGIDALACNMLTVGVAYGDSSTGEAAMSVPWPDAFPSYWKPEQAKIVKEWVERLMANPRTTVVYHNKSYDIPVLRRHVPVVATGTADTLLLHHAVYPKLPHGLEQVTAQFIPTEPWKSEYNISAKMIEQEWDAVSGGAETYDDEETEEATPSVDVQALSDKALSELLWYNAADAAATMKLYSILEAEAKADNVWDVYQRDNELMDIAIDWHRDGVGIDLEQAEKLAVEYRADLDELEEELRKLCGFVDQSEIDLQTQAYTLAIDGWRAARRSIRRTEPVDAPEVVEIDERLKELRKERRDQKKRVSWQQFNPRSPIQLRDVLDLRGLTPTKVTKKTMMASTSKDSLWDLRGDEFIDVLFRWRTKHKAWSTYLRPMARKLGPDGRIHPVWKLHATPSGRFGTEPAVQNWPSAFKKMMIASEGCKIVGADYAALELRITALVSGEPEWLDLFQKGGDLHAAMAYYYFPAEFPALDEEWNAVEGDEDAKDEAVPGRKALRKAGKSVTFGDIYLATAPTLYDQIRVERPDVKTAAEQKRLLREVTAMQKRLRAATPLRMEWAAQQHREAEENLYLTSIRWPDMHTGEMQGGRLRKWPMGEASPNETANHGIQPVAADIMNAATRRLAGWLKDLRLYRNGIWIILQIHDALYLEVEDVPLCERFDLLGLKEAKEIELLGIRATPDMPLPEFAARLLEKAMWTRIECRSFSGEINWMEFPADARVGDNVGEV